MVTKKMKPAKILQLARRAARRQGLTIEEVSGRGKGSHRFFALIDSAGVEIARFGITGHNKELSWTVLRSVEADLTDLFGEKWLEER